MRYVFASIYLASLSIAVSVAQADDHGAEEAFRAALVRASKQHQLPSISAAIATRQGVIWTGAVGYANLETHSRANAAYLYGIGSITKTFVACIVERLVDQGQLSLDATAANILGPEVVAGIPNADRATIRQLLNHTSGIPTWEFDAEWIRKGRGAESIPQRLWGKAETLDYVRGSRHPATNAPGTSYAYANTNYTLLGLVVEKITSRDIVDVLHNDLLEPLGLADIRLEGFEPIDPSRIPARYHYDTTEFRRTAGLSPAFHLAAPGLIDVSRSNLSTEWTAGGLLATARDLAAFTLALRDGRVVAPATLARMVSFAPTGEAGEEVGQGLFHERLADDWLIGYDGGVLGFGAVMGWLEHGDLVVVIMTNVGMMHAGNDAWYPLQLVRSKAFVRAARRLALELSPRSAAP
jgi:CubicO group peptidase (beta-lactamase class C family)